MEISPEYLLEGLMLKLKLQYFGHLMQRANSLEETLMLGRIEPRRRRGYRGWEDWMASLTQWTWVWASSRSWWWTGKLAMLQSTGLHRVGHNWCNLAAAAAAAMGKKLRLLFNGLLWKMYYLSCTLYSKVDNILKQAISTWLTCCRLVVSIL